MKPPAWVNIPEVVGFEQLSHVGLALASPAPDQRHIGILHRHEDGPVLFLHLAWHHQMRNEPPKSHYIWISPKLPRAVRRFVAALCRRVAARHLAGGLPYGLDSAQTRFDLSTGELIVDDEDSGLTCATFVLALFRSHNIDLLRTREWPTRSDDQLWLDRICDLLEQGSAPAVHVQRVRSGRGTLLRCRPEEVFSGARHVPASFAQASRDGSELVRFLGAPRHHTRAPVPWPRRWLESIGRMVRGWTHRP